MQAWDLNEAPPEASTGTQSLVAASDIGPLCADVAAAVRQLAARLREGGFLLLHEYTGPYTLLLHALSDKAALPRWGPLPHAPLTLVRAKYTLMRPACLGLQVPREAGQKWDHDFA